MAATARAFAASSGPARRVAGQRAREKKGKHMSDEVEEVPRTYSGALLAAIAVALLLGLGGLIWSYTLNSKLSSQQQELADAKAHNVKLDAQLRETDERLNV